jgi:hypothetical protein
VCGSWVGLAPPPLGQAPVSSRARCCGCLAARCNRGGGGAGPPSSLVATACGVGRTQRAGCLCGCSATNMGSRRRVLHGRSLLHGSWARLGHACQACTGSSSSVSTAAAVQCGWLCRAVHLCPVGRRVSSAPQVLLASRLWVAGGCAVLLLLGCVCLASAYDCRLLARQPALAASVW